MAYTDGDTTVLSKKEAEYAFASMMFVELIASGEYDISIIGTVAADIVAGDFSAIINNSQRPSKQLS